MVVGLDDLYVVGRNPRAKAQSVIACVLYECIVGRTKGVIVSVITLFSSIDLNSIRGDKSVISRISVKRYITVGPRQRQRAREINLSSVIQL